MRNAIIHDYLNLDWQAVQAVISNKKYQLVCDFAQEGCKHLNSHD